ncbi:hypothetical protein [Nonomuraea endophytica]|uniref:hypothetical protein n=1 Tax=Nonomuraea endophytica TaxID=714136 RepID=UPI0037CB1676
MTDASIVPIRPADDITPAAAAARRHLDRCKLVNKTVKTYKRQSTAYLTWLAEHASDHPRSRSTWTDVSGNEPVCFMTPSSPTPVVATALGLGDRLLWLEGRVTGA